MTARVGAAKCQDTIISTGLQAVQHLASKAALLAKAVLLALLLAACAHRNIFKAST